MKELIIFKLMIIKYLKHSILPYHKAHDSLNHRGYMKATHVNVFAQASAVFLQAPGIRQATVT